MQGNNLIAFVKNIFILQVFLIIIITGVGLDFTGIKVTNSEKIESYRPLWPQSLFTINSSMAVDLLAFNSVSLAGQGEPVLWTGEDMPRKLVEANLGMAASRGQQLNEQELPVTWDDMGSPVLADEADDMENKYFETLNEYKAVLYCTHSTETYIPDAGKPNEADSQGLVNEVARSLAERLEHGGMQAEFIDTIHDYPDYDKSYTLSRQTVTETVNSEKQLAALFDIHRDHIPEAESAETVNLKGEMAARILIIAGTDERKDHPYWEENLAFAEKLHRQGEEMYPGLIKGVRTRPGTYNQEFFERSLLLEFGTDYNSLDEARHAAGLFAEILLEVLEDEYGG